MNKKVEAFKKEAKLVRAKPNRSDINHKLLDFAKNLEGVAKIANVYGGKLGKSTETEWENLSPKGENEMVSLLKQAWALRNKLYTLLNNGLPELVRMTFPEKEEEPGYHPFRIVTE